MLFPQVFRRSASPPAIHGFDYSSVLDMDDSETSSMATDSPFTDIAAASYYPFVSGSLPSQAPSTGTSSGVLTDYQLAYLATGRLPLKSAAAQDAPYGASASSDPMLAEVNTAPLALNVAYGNGTSPYPDVDFPGYSISPLSSGSSGAGVLLTPDNGNEHLGLLDVYTGSFNGWDASSYSEYNKDNALAFLANGNNGNNVDKAPDVAGGSGGLPVHDPLAPSITSSTAADVAEHEPDRRDVHATHVAAPTLSSVRHATSSRSRANYSFGGKTIPGAPIVLAHSDAADDVDDHERAATTVKRPRKKRAQRAAAEVAQFAPAEDPCAHDEALARQLEHELSLPRTRRSSGSSASSTKRKRNGAEVDVLAQSAQDVVSSRPLRGKSSRTSRRAVTAPNPLATAVSDFDIVMSEDDQPSASTSRSPNPSRPTKAFPSRTVKRSAAVPTSTYAFDSNMGDDNVFASSSRLPKSTDDDDDDFVCPSDADDSEDEDWTLRPKGSQKRKNESKASAGRSKKRVRATAPESDAEEEIDEVQEDPNEPVPGVKVLEKRYGIYVTSADLRKRKADVKVPGDLHCRTCNKILADDDSYRRHMVATLQHQPAGYKYHPHMCNLCGDDSVRRDSLLRHVFHLHKGKKKATKRVARMLKEHDALWKDRAVNSRISRRVCAEE